MDISYKIQHNDKNYRFNYRVGAIIELDNKFLIHKKLEENYWYLPGGRVKLGETAHEALIRELEEELNIQANILSMPFVIENFFELEGETFHEISFLFKIDEKNLILPANEEIIDGMNFIWRNRKEIQDIKLVPAFLKTELIDIPQITKHIVFNQFKI